MKIPTDYEKYTEWGLNMLRSLEWVVKILFCYSSAIIFQCMRWGWLRFLFDGWPYNCPTYSSVILLLFIALGTIPFVLILKWTTRIFD